MTRVSVLLMLAASAVLSAEANLQEGSRAARRAHIQHGRALLKDRSPDLLDPIFGGGSDAPANPGGAPPDAGNGAGGAGNGNGAATGTDTASQAQGTPPIGGGGGGQDPPAGGALSSTTDLGFWGKLSTAINGMGPGKHQTTTENTQSLPTGTANMTRTFATQTTTPPAVSTPAPTGTDALVGEDSTSFATVTRTVSGGQNADAPATPAQSTLNSVSIARKTIIALVAIGGSIVAVFLIWTAFRKWKLKNNRSLEDRMVSWEPSQTTHGGSGYGNSTDRLPDMGERYAGSVMHGSGYAGSAYGATSVAAAGAYGAHQEKRMSAGSNRSYGSSDMHNYGSTQSPMSPAPGYGYDYHSSHASGALSPPPPAVTPGYYQPYDNGHSSRMASPAPVQQYPQHPMSPPPRAASAGDDPFRNPSPPAASSQGAGVIASAVTRHSAGSLHSLTQHDQSPYGGEYAGAAHDVPPHHGFASSTGARI